MGCRQRPHADVTVHSRCLDASCKWVLIYKLTSRQLASGEAAIGKLVTNVTYPTRSQPEIENPVHLTTRKSLIHYSWHTSLPGTHTHGAEWTEKSVRYFLDCNCRKKAILQWKTNHSNTDSRSVSTWMFSVRFFFTFVSHDGNNRRWGTKPDPNVSHKN